MAPPLFFNEDACPESGRNREERYGIACQEAISFLPHDAAGQLRFGDLAPPVRARAVSHTGQGLRKRAGLTAEALRASLCLPRAALTRCGVARHPAPGGDAVVGRGIRQAAAATHRPRLVGAGGAGGLIRRRRQSGAGRRDLTPRGAVVALPGHRSGRKVALSSRPPRPGAAASVRRHSARLSSVFPRPATARRRV